MLRSRERSVFILAVIALISLALPLTNVSSDTKVISSEIRQAAAPAAQLGALLEEDIPVVPLSPTVTLMISGYLTVGNGGGAIRIENTGAQCHTPDFCQYTFNRGDKITLKAIPDVGSFFPGWYILFKDDNGAFLPVEQPCPDKVDTCELTLDNGAVVAPPLFLPDVDVDIAVKSLTVSPKDLAVGGVVTLSTEMQNLGMDNSINFQTSVGVSQIQRYMSGTTWVTNVWGWSSDTFSSTLNAGAKWTWSGQSIPLPREGKYIVESRGATAVDTNHANDVLRDVVYVTVQAKATVKGSLLKYDRKPIKNATLVLSGPMSRSVTLSRTSTSYTFSNLKLGKYTLTLNSRDYQPVKHTFEILSGTEIKTIPVGLKDKDDRRNRKPIASAKITPTEGKLSQIFVLDASASRDRDNDPLRYIWDFGDGFTYREGKTVEYRFWNAGINTVRLTVVDPFGASSTFDLNVNVINDRPVRPRVPVDDIGDQFNPPAPLADPRPLLADPVVNPPADPNLGDEDTEFWGI